MAYIPIIKKLTGSVKLTLIAGSIIAVCFTALVPLPTLRGPNVVTFLTFFIIAALAYSIALLCILKALFPLKIIWGFAIFFRLILILTPPTLSDDVYRYIWDGHLINAGVNPYAHPVNSDTLDVYSTPLRDLVNNDWMASPYLPSAQLVFAVVEFLFSQSVLAFQLIAMLIDLATAWLIMNILRGVGLPIRYLLIYLWNPLVILEFSHGAHIVDALMILLIMVTFWILFKNRPNINWGVPIALAAATLTKALPILLIPIFIRRLWWKKLFAYGVILVGICALVATGSGWGLTGPTDGTGLFGAIRIYLAWWKYNSSIYHWLETWISGYQTSGAVPFEILNGAPVQFVRIITAALLGLVVLITLATIWIKDKPEKMGQPGQLLFLLRLATLPIGAYLLLTHTLHPWYVTFIMPFLPFLFPTNQEENHYGWFAIPWLYLSLALPLSYLSYLDPANFREFSLVRGIEYFPFYFLLAVAIIINLPRRKKLLANAIIY